MCFILKEFFMYLVRLFILVFLGINVGMFLGSEMLFAVELEELESIRGNKESFSYIITLPSDSNASYSYSFDPETKKYTAILDKKHVKVLFDKTKDVFSLERASSIESYTSISCKHKNSSMANEKSYLCKSSNDNGRILAEINFYKNTGWIRLPMDPFNNEEKFIEVMFFEQQQDGKVNFYFSSGRKKEYREVIAGITYFDERSEIVDFRKNVISEKAIAEISFVKNLEKSFHSLIILSGHLFTFINNSNIDLIGSSSDNMQQDAMDLFRLPAVADMAAYVSSLWLKKK
jgi:hypothetical protein